MKLLSTLFVTVLIVTFSSVTSLTSFFGHLFSSEKASSSVNATGSITSYFGVATATDDIVAKAQAFKALLTSTQITTLQQTYTSDLAGNWSNLPCGSQCRNGLEFTTLSSEQLAAALAVIQAAAGTSTDEGYDEFEQIRTADSILGVSGGNGYSKFYYFISFLNEPSTIGQWMLQYGGHHYAANIAFNGGLIVGTTPLFEGVEPKSFTAANGTTYTPLAGEHDAMYNLLNSLTTTELENAKLTTTFSDVLLGPDQDGQFPSTKLGLAVSTLTTAQKALVTAAMQPWVYDVEDVTRDSLMSIYNSELDSTYISFSGNSGTSAFTAQGDYMRIDGPSVWIEFVCQNGVVFPSQIHYHSVWRDHKRDYGVDLSNTALPLSLTGFAVTVQSNKRIISWNTVNETNVSRFEIERSLNPSGGYVNLGSVNAKNSTANSYSFTDNQTVTGQVLYYRLKITDADGRVNYSKIVSVKISETQALAVYPNPPNNKITITAATVLRNATITISNSGGKEVINRTNQTGSQVTIDISKLPAGMYFIHISDEGNISTARFIKQN